MPRTKHLLLALAVVCVAAAATAVAAVSSGRGASRTAAVDCQLSANGQIKHLVNIVFDNTHYTRDRANVASDLQQMPHVLDFLTSNGTLFTNDHTILISHYRGRDPELIDRPLSGPAGADGVEHVRLLQERFDSGVHVVVQVLDGAG